MKECLDPPKSEDKYVEKVFNWSEVHLSEMTCYKIHTLRAPVPMFSNVEDIRKNTLKAAV